MKLLIILSVIACSYAAKLDRTYLPPPSAGSAGGSPGSLTAPFGSGLPGLSGLTQPSGSSRVSQPSGPSSFGQSPESGFDQITFAKSRPTFGQQTTSAQTSQASGPVQYQPSRPVIGNAPFGFQTPSTQYGQPSTGFEQSKAAEVNFGKSSLSQFASEIGESPSSYGQSQEANVYSAQSYQPERARASLDRNAEILRYDNQNDGETFAYSFETSNGITAEESGVATNGVQAQGGFSYTDDDGQVFRVTYTADENGYQPQGDHLPTPPPIPNEILRSIEENARAAAAGIQEGAYNPDEDSSGFVPQQYSTGPAPSYQGKGPSSLQTGVYNQLQGQAQGPQQFGTPSTTSALNQAAPSAGSSNFQGLNQPNQYKSEYFQNGQISRSQPSQSGYEYNKPETSSAFGRQSTPSNQRPAIQYMPASSKPQNNGAQKSFLKGIVTVPASSSYGQGPIATGIPEQDKENRPSQQGSSSLSSGAIQGYGPAQSPSNQGSAKFSATGQNQKPAFPTGASQELTRASSSSNLGVSGSPTLGQLQGSTFSTKTGTNQGLSGASPVSGPNNQEIFSGSSAFGEPQRSQSFPSSASQVFGSASGLNNKGAPESSAQGNGQYQPSQPSRSSMSQSAPYEYSRPSQQSGVTQPPFNSGSQQPGIKSPSFNQGRPGQTFGAPRQPPSFTAEEGYKY